jgi:hypothetical protein
MNPTYKRVTQFAMAGAVSLLVGTGAEGAVVKGSSDPSFGGSYARLGFRGEATFYIDTGCLNGADTSSGTVAENNDSSSCSMSFLGATVELYDFNDPSKPTLDTLNYAGSPSPTYDTVVNWMTIDSILGVNTVTGVDTDILGTVFATVTTAYPPATTIYSGDVSLWFEIWDWDPAFIGLGTCDDSEGVYCEYNNEPANSAPAPITGGKFTTVPEPGSLALALGALGAGWWVRRRKTKT